MQITSQLVARRIDLGLPRIWRKRINSLDRQVRFRRISSSERYRVPVILIIRAGRNRQQRENRGKRFTFY